GAAGSPPSPTCRASSLSSDPMTGREPIGPIRPAPRAPTSARAGASVALPETNGSKASTPRVARRVENVRVFSARDAPLYAFLSVFMIAALAWLVSFWVAHAEWSPQTPAYVFLTATVVFPLTMFAARW